MALNQNLQIVAASPSFYRTFQLVCENVVGHPLYEIDGGQWDLPELRAILEDISKNHAPVSSTRVSILSATSGYAVSVRHATFKSQPLAVAEEPASA